MSYWRFFAMIITSTVVMFGLMYLNTYAIDHVFFSETRSYMALYMGAVMAVIMLAFMLGMYSNRGVNIAIFAGSALVFAVSLFLVRSQSTVDDTAWMRAMIPHHSIAILTSERANISDPRVRKLADDIIEAQRLEIDEMKALIADLEGGPAETDAFKAEHDVETTPQSFIGGERIGGYDDLRVYFGLDKPKDQQSDTSYQPVIAIFSVAFLMALGLSWFAFESIFTVQAFQWFISISMCLLAVQKLQDIESFSTMFLNYDLLAKRWVPYGKIYPFGEAFAGIAMTAGALLWLAAPIAIVIGGIGAISVIKAVYIDKRELKCACVGGSSNVPLGFVSLTENLMMLGMGLWMLVRLFG